MGEVGYLLGLRRQAAPLVRHQPRAPLLRADRRERRGHVRLVGELLEEADLLGDDGVARRLLGDLAYRSGQLEEALASAGVLLTTEKAATGGPLKGSRWRCDSRRSSGYSGWPRRWRGSSPGSRRRSALTPTPSWSTGCWADRRGASKTCRPRNHATLI